MAGCPLVTLYVLSPDGGLSSMEKALPWERDMPVYALSFLFPEEEVAFQCAVRDGTATVDIEGFPAYTEETRERNAVASVVNTLLGFPEIQAVDLLFFGEKVVRLKNGTAVFAPFTETLSSVDAAP